MVIFLIKEKKLRRREEFKKEMYIALRMRYVFMDVPTPGSPHSIIYSKEQVKPITLEFLIDVLDGI